MAREEINMRILIVLTSILLIVPAHAEKIRINWNGNYAHNSTRTWSKDNLYDSGWSRNFKNGTPQEFGEVKKDGEIPTEILLPPNTTGPVPFVMIMHHCSGYQPSMIWMEMVAKRFLAEGYGVAMPNSFDPRYVDSSCGLPDLHWGRRRAEDAYSVLDYLIERKLAVPNQVYITGYSNGGLTSLVALTKRMAGHKNKFAAAFPIVPSCISVTIKGGDYYNPVVVFVGGKDQANLPKYCIELGQKKRSTPVQVFILKDADHGYMINKPAIVYKVSADQGGMSWSMTYNEAATNFTMDTILNALSTKQFAKNSMVFK